MASIVFRDVTIEFPMLNFEHRSIKKKVASAATGGLIVAEARRVPCVRALADVDLRIGGGDRVGLIGPNGAGKTTLLRAMAGVYEPTRGQVDVEGRVMSLLDIGLQPDMTGTENIRLRGLLQGLGRGARAEMADEIASFSELGDFLDMPVRTYSSGMAMRLAFALATHGAPEILLMDEWIMVGDAAFLKKASDRMRAFVDRANVLVLASHSEAIIRENCNRVVYISGGRILADGAPDDVFSLYGQGV